MIIAALLTPTAIMLMRESIGTALAERKPRRYRIANFQMSALFNIRREIKWFEQMIPDVWQGYPAAEVSLLAAPELTRSSAIFLKMASILKM